jgi:ATP-dependent protease ClpP protease subunit
MTIKTFEALASGETLELRIYGPIGANFFGDGVSADSVARALEYAPPNIKTILVRISSPGGNAYDGMAIRSMLLSHPAEKVCEVEGLAASAGSIVAMGCGKIRMHTGSAMMIHEATAVIGKPCSADDMRKVLAGIETLNDGMASVYAERTGKSKKKCAEMMAAETWLTPEQAIKDGFCDELVPGVVKVAASFDLTAFGYRHVPKDVADAFGATSLDAPLFTAEEVDALRELIAAPEDDDDEPEANESEGDDGSDEDSEEDAADPDEDDSVETTPTETVPPQDAVATNAEADASRKRYETMTIKLIAQAIGLQADADESAVVAAVSRAQSLFAELRTLTAASDLDGVLGAVRGLVESAKQLPVLKAQIEQQAKSIEDQERAAIIAADKADPKGRKLTPAVEAVTASWPLTQLKAYLAAAPHVVNVESPAKSSKQPPVQTTGSSAPASSGAEPVKFNGKAYEEMSPNEKHDLHESDLEMYAAVRQSFVERGSPRAQSQQQRASA